MKLFKSFSGTLIDIVDVFMNQDKNTIGCFKLMSVEDDNKDIVNFIVFPQTYFVNYETLSIGDKATGFYDANAPVPLIFPPQYRALVMSKNHVGKNVKVSYFNNELVSSDNQLKIIPSSKTKIVLQNNQYFTQNISNRNLIVVYGPSTKSIPTQTTPYEIVVIC